jgi:hypothetical protein
MAAIRGIYSKRPLKRFNNNNAMISVGDSTAMNALVVVGAIANPGMRYLIPSEMPIDRPNIFKVKTGMSIEQGRLTRSHELTLTRLSQRRTGWGWAKYGQTDRLSSYEIS